jgi:hypothetical protein
LAQPAGPAPGGPPPPNPLPVPDETPWAMSQGNRAGLQFDFWPSHIEFDFGPVTSSINIYEFVWCPYAQIELVKHVYLDVELPFAYVTASVSTESSDPNVTVKQNDESNDAFAFGQPTIGAHYGANVTPELAFHAGGTVSVPTLIHITDDARIAAAAYAINSRADFDSHRFFLDHMPIRARGGIEYRILPELYYRGDIAPVFAIPFNHTESDGSESNNKVEFFIDQGNEIEYRLDSGLGFGFRFQEVFILTEHDKIQTAAEPFIGYEPSHPGVYARLGFLVALDKSAGFGFDQGKVASLRTTVGGKW